MDKCEACKRRKGGIRWNNKTWCAKCLERALPPPDPLTVLVLEHDAPGTDHQANSDALIAAVKDTDPLYRDSNGYGHWILVRGQKAIAIHEESVGWSIKNISDALTT